jgi:hypothetical protein
MSAAATGNADITKRLLLAGAQTELRNPFGQTALDIAVAKRHGDIAALLRTYPARAQAQRQQPVSAPPVPADRVLLACALLGGVLALGALELFSHRPTVFSYAQFRDFLTRDRLAKVNLKRQGSDRWLECEVLNNPDHLDVRTLELRGNKFIVVDFASDRQVRHDIDAHHLLRKRQPPEPTFVTTQILGAPELPWGPSYFVMAQMLALPVIVAVACGAFLSQLLPALHTAGLRPWRRAGK